MPISLILLTVAHAAAAIAWAMVTWVISRKPAEEGRKLFLPQGAAAIVTLGAGARLWTMLHAGGTGPVEMLLGAGAALGVLALLAQLFLRRWSVKVNKVTFWMLIIALVLMELGKQLKGL